MGRGVPRRDRRNRQRGPGKGATEGNSEDGDGGDQEDDVREERKRKDGTADVKYWRGKKGTAGREEREAQTYSMLATKSEDCIDSALLQ